MLPRELPVLRADARRVVQVLTNLFTNAAKYSAPTTPIIVTAEKGEKEVTVHVRDAGVGIAAEKMPLLFRKFVQVQERGVKGTGLGLFICKGIVEAHGGRIWAESDGKGKGTVFSFTLPAVAGKTAPKHKGAAAGRGGVGRNAAERPFRIVAVDDEPDILHYIEHCLRSANCEVVSTSDPLAAAELVRFHAPDIVLLDMRMPGMSGLEVLEEIRKFCQTPVTFITATQNREDVVRGREFGGTTWLEKPFSPQQLLDHVGLVLARRRRR
jgi:CheY-like chemotaxis protein